MNYQDKNVLVIGMARSGASSAELLNKLGANVTIYDVKTLDELPKNVRKQLGALEYNDMLGLDPTDVIDEMDLLVLSPGVPLGLPFIKKAYELNKKVIAEIELGYSVSKADFIAITGTNGKTTTATLTSEIFKEAGINTYLLGNIGTPITQEAMHTKKGDVIVAETSSFQLETIDKFRPKGSAILNIAADHMDRYEDIDHYIAAKARIFNNQTREEYCVLNYDDLQLRNIAEKAAVRAVWFSAEHKVKNGAYIEDNQIVFADDGKESVILPVDELQIPGNHNLENALAAVALASLYGIDKKTIAKSLRRFKGVEHRLEFVREVDGVTFINDSKGTNIDATISAVRAMDQPTVIILGGYDKHSDFTELFESFTKNVKAAIVLGSTAAKIITAAQKTGFENYIKASGFEDAVHKAYSIAEAGEMVLLSPACASWDMFADFEERGDEFKKIVNQL